ncbi:MAG: SDR family oxidoreductase [Owenweeksia sp.]|nr:SDR family oxidoreductase [Owenweeksia sp.]
MKNVVITGASKGIGYATALAFAEEGHQVLALARSEKLLKELARQVQDSPGQLFIQTCDIRDLDVSEVTNFFPQVDILINNAGCLVNKPFTEIGAEELQEMYEVNVFAPFRLVQKLMSVFSPQAHIINVSSVGGVNGTQKFPGLSAYSSSKAAMSCLSECWQAEYADTDLTFNSLALGSVQTEMLAKAFPGLKAAATPAQMAGYIIHFALNAPDVLKGKTHSSKQQ